MSRFDPERACVFAGVVVGDTEKGRNLHMNRTSRWGETMLMLYAYLVTLFASLAFLGAIIVGREMEREEKRREEQVREMRVRLWRVG